MDAGNFVREPVITEYGILIMRKKCVTSCRHNYITMCHSMHMQANLFAGMHRIGKYVWQHVL